MDFMPKLIYLKMTKEIISTELYLIILPVKLYLKSLIPVLDIEQPITRDMEQPSTRCGCNLQLRLCKGEMRERNFLMMKYVTYVKVLGIFQTQATLTLMTLNIGLF